MCEIHYISVWLSHLDCQRLPLFQTLPNEGSQLASVCELWSKLAPTLFGGSFLNFSCSSEKTQIRHVKWHSCYPFVWKHRFILTGFDDKMSGWFLLCLRKSCSEGPIWACVAVPDIPSRGSSRSQGGTAPTKPETKGVCVCVCVCVVLASLLSWQDFNSGFQTPTWLYLYEHFHCLMNPGEVEKHKRVSNAFKTHLNQLQKSFFMSGRSDHLVTNESQALSSCTPRSVSINHATSCWPAGPLWCKLRAAPKTRWVQFVLLTKRKRGSKARGRLGVYLPAFSADVFMPLGPFNNSGSASRWHWFRKSQTWFTQQIWALIITYALAFFSRITVKFSFFFPFLDIKHSITDSPVCIYGWT